MILFENKNQPPLNTNNRIATCPLKGVVGTTAGVTICRAIDQRSQTVHHHKKTPTRAKCFVSVTPHNDCRVVYDSRDFCSSAVVVAVLLRLLPIARECIFTLSSHIRAGRWYRSGLCSKIGFSRIPSAKMYTLAIVDTFS